MEIVVLVIIINWKLHVFDEHINCPLELVFIILQLLLDTFFALGHLQFLVVKLGVYFEL